MNVGGKFGLIHWPNSVVPSALFSIVSLECVLRHPDSQMARLYRIKLNTKLNG